MKIVKNGLAKQERVDEYYKTAAPIVEEYFAEWAKEGHVGLFKSFSYLMLAIVLAILMGDDFRHKHGEELIPMMAHHERDLQDPMLRILPPALWSLCSAGRNIFRSQARFKEIVTAEMKERLAHKEELAHRTDYFSLVLRQCGDKYAFCYGMHIIGLVFGGHANVAMTLPWMFLHARRKPGTLERWRKEVLAQDNASYEPKEDEQTYARRPFLEACMRETGRLYSHTTIMRFTRKSVNVAGHRVPARTLVACSPLTTQRDDSIYANADTWDPDRFLQDGAYTSWFQRAQFLQFGMGQHACPGERLAKMVIVDLVMSTWMRKYELEAVGGLREGEVGVDGVGAQPAWTEENFGTPYVRGEDVRVKVKLRGV